LQWEYFDHAKKYVKESESIAEYADLLQWWETVLSGIEEDPLSMSRELGWVAKYRMLEAYRERGGLDWRDGKLAMIDLQYHDVRRSRGLYHRLGGAGQIPRLAPQKEIERGKRN